MPPARTTQRSPVLAASEALGCGSGTAVPHRSSGCGHGHLVLRVGHWRKTKREPAPASTSLGPAPSKVRTEDGRYLHVGDEGRTAWAWLTPGMESLDPAGAAASSPAWSPGIALPAGPVPPAPARVLPGFMEKNRNVPKVGGCSRSSVLGWAGDENKKPCEPFAS